MKLINVCMSVALAKLAGSSRLRVMLDEEATVGDLFEQLSSQYPALSKRLAEAFTLEICTLKR